MAIGDAAASAGMDLVSNSSPANTLGTEDNKTRDYIAQRTNAVQPVAKGGTGATTASDARTNLGAVAVSDVFESGGSVANKIAKYDSSGRLIVATPAATNQAAPKVYVDQRVAKSGDTMTGDLKLPNADTVSSSYVGLYIQTADGKVCRGSSSRRYKQHIQDADPDLFAGVLDLRPRTFQRRRKGNFSEVGLIAEEVANAVPWLVVNDEKGRPEAVNYEQLALALLPIVQDLAGRVAQLEAERAA